MPLKLTISKIRQKPNLVHLQSTNVRKGINAEMVPNDDWGYFFNRIEWIETDVPIAKWASIEDWASGAPAVNGCTPLLEIGFSRFC